MVCPNCGNVVNGGACTRCGAVFKKGRPTGLIVLSIILAVVIAACAAVYLLVIPGQDDIGSVARNYMTAAYYTDKVVGSAASYASYDDFTKDLDIAIDTCGAVNGGAFDFLANADIDISFARTAFAADALEDINTDADRTYSGGYTIDAKENADTFLAAMKKDADAAKQALKELDAAVNQTTEEADILDALSDAADALKDADNAKIVVGDKVITFAGISTIEAINTAFIGADIVIDDDVLYLGMDAAVMFGGGGIGSEVTVINSQSGGGIVMDTGDMTAQLTNGALTIITFDTMGETPHTAVFSPAEKQLFMDMISEGADDSAADGDAPGSDNTAGQGTAVYEGGENLNASFLIGTWQYDPAVINPWVSLSEDEIKEAETLLENLKTPGSSLTYADKAHEKFMIFREDGTGIEYWVVEDVGINQVQGFWWHIDAPTGEVVLSFKHSPSNGFETVWTDDALQDMENFQKGDYSNFHSSTLFYWRKHFEDLYYIETSAAYENCCIVYKKISNSTDFE